MKTIKQEIKSTLKDYNKTKDVNHWLRRHARCYFDGSYDYKNIGYNQGYDFYNSNLKRFEMMKKTLNEKQQKTELKNKVIYYFKHFIVKEFECSYSHAQKSIVESMSKEDLSELTNELINDYCEIYS